MAAKLIRLTHKIAIQLYLVGKCCTTCSSRSRRPVWKLLDTPSYIHTCIQMPTQFTLINKLISLYKLKHILRCAIRVNQSVPGHQLLWLGVQNPTRHFVGYSRRQVSSHVMQWKQSSTLSHCYVDRKFSYTGPLTAAWHSSDSCAVVLAVLIAYH
jgi:hypothetical protein